MNTTLIQHWQVGYLCAALLFAAAAMAVGDVLRSGDPPAAPTRATAALTAGALWPVLIVGVVQLWLVARLARRGAPVDRWSVAEPEHLGGSDQTLPTGRELPALHRVA